MKRIWVGIVLTLIMLVVGCSSGTTAPSPSATPASRPQITVSPMTGQAGKTPLTIYGSGFVPGEKVRVTVSVPGLDISLAKADTGGFIEANAYGAFALKPDGGIPAPAVIKPGVYTLLATGDKGSIASSPLEVQEPPKK